MITRFAIIIGMLSAAFLSPGANALALEPNEVLVVVNASVPAGAKLAAYYMQLRGIPKDNIVRVSVPNDETISRKHYNDKIVDPVRQALKGSEDRRRIRCLLLMYGIPLRVMAPEIGPDDKRQIAMLAQRREETRRRIEALPAGAKEEKERLGKRPGRCRRRHRSRPKVRPLGLGRFGDRLGGRRRLPARRLGAQPVFPG